MFFGLEVKTQQQQAKPITLPNTLKLSQAVLEPKGSNGKKEPVSLVVEYNKKSFILCVLDPNLSWQCPLDLLFEGGSQVKFYTRGNGTVHLTGYENFDDLDDMSMSMSSDELECVSDDEQQLKQAKPMKALKSPSNSSKKAAKPTTNGDTKKSPKKPGPVEEFPEDSDSDDDDFDVDIDEDDDSDLNDDDEEDDDDVDDEDGDEEMDTDSDEEGDSDDSSAEE